MIYLELKIWKFKKIKRKLKILMITTNLSKNILILIQILINIRVILKDPPKKIILKKRNIIIMKFKILIKFKKIISEKLKTKKLVKDLGRMILKNKTFTKKKIIIIILRSIKINYNRTNNYNR